MTDTTFPRPDETPLTRPFWDALVHGHLTFQRCRHCAAAWLPARSECPQCLNDGPAWEAASGRARLVSWVVYETAYHPAFADRLPYVVAVVELAEGPRLLTNILDDPSLLRIEQPLDLVIQFEDELAVPRFRIATARPA